MQRQALLTFVPLSIFLILSNIPEVLSYLIVGVLEFLFITVTLRVFGYSVKEIHRNGRIYKMPTRNGIFASRTEFQMAKTFALIFAITFFGIMSSILNEIVSSFISSLDITARLVVGFSLYPVFLIYERELA